MINQTIMRSLIVRQTQYNYIHVLLLTIPHWIYSKKTSTGNHGFYHLIWGFSVNLPIITFCENRFFSGYILYIPLHTYDYPFVDDFHWFSEILAIPNSLKPWAKNPCIANQIPSGYLSVRYGQRLIWRWFTMMYRFWQMLTFQFATLKNQRVYLNIYIYTYPHDITV